MVNTDEFELQVRKQAARRDDMPGQTVNQAIQEFTKNGRAQLYEVANCLMRARKIAQGSGHQQRSSRGLPATGKGRALAATLRRVVEEQSCGVRQALFGSEEPPFRTVTQAAAWIASEAGQPPPAIDDPAIDKLRDELWKKVETINRMLQGRGYYSLPCWVEFLPYQKPNSEWVHNIPVVGGTCLGTLQEACKRMHTNTGIPEDAIVMYVLKGGRLGYPAVAISAGLRTSRLPNGDRIVREECKITIKVPDLTFKQLRNLYQLWRRRQSPLNRGLSAAEEQTLALVEKRGNPPPKGTPEASRFWRTVQKDGKKAGRHWQTVNAPMTLYRKALKKLGRIHKRPTARARRSLARHGHRAAPTQGDGLPAPAQAS